MKCTIIGIEPFKDKNGNENVNFYVGYERPRVTGMYPDKVTCWARTLTDYPQLQQVCVNDKVNFEFDTRGQIIGFLNYGNK